MVCFCRAETAIIAALLHDTLDDTHTTLEELHEAFGPQVATCVENVSRLSMVNQMLRRHLRQRVSSAVFDLIPLSCHGFNFVARGRTTAESQQAPQLSQCTACAAARLCS